LEFDVAQSPATWSYPVRRRGQLADRWFLLRRS